MEDAIPEKLPILGKETDLQFQEAPRTPSRINPQRATSPHIVIKMSKIKDKMGILQQQEKCSKLPTREIQLSYQWLLSRHAAGHREGHLAFKMLKVKKKKKLHSRVFYPESLLFRFEGEFKSSAAKQTKRVQHHETNFTRNFNRTSQSWKEQATSTTMKITKGNLIG